MKKGRIVINLDKIPKNCTECDWFLTQYEEEPDWGSGVTHHCAFGASIWKAAIERPKDCPIEILSPVKINSKYRKINK